MSFSTPFAKKKDQALQNSKCHDKLDPCLNKIGFKKTKKTIETCRNKCQYQHFYDERQKRIHSLT